MNARTRNSQTDTETRLIPSEKCLRNRTLADKLKRAKIPAPRAARQIRLSVDPGKQRGEISCVNGPKADPVPKMFAHLQRQALPLDAGHSGAEQIVRDVAPQPVGFRRVVRVLKPPHTVLELIQPEFGQHLDQAAGGTPIQSVGKTFGRL